MKRHLPRLLSAARVALRRHAPAFVPDAARPPESLTGGYLNHVWRLRSSDGRTLIVKQAPPYVAAHPDMPLSPDRLTFEARTLALFARGGRLQVPAESAPIRPPRLIAFDATRHCLLLEDVGPATDLAARVATSPRVAHWGEALGRFIAAVHRGGLQPKFPATDFDNAAVQAARYRVQYQAVGEIAHHAGVARWKEMGARAESFGKSLLGPGRCLIMGDLWPRSVLVDAADRLRVIDWEFAHFGQPAQDLGHFAAHCWMQAHTAASPALARRHRALWASFARSYRRALGPTAAHLLDAATIAECNIHAGAEILMRCAGPFVSGYVYDGRLPAHEPVASALAQAERLLLRPDESDFFARSREKW